MQSWRNGIRLLEKIAKKVAFHLKSKPVSYKIRHVFEFHLDSPVPALQPKLPINFCLEVPNRNIRIPLSNPIDQLSAYLNEEWHLLGHVEDKEVFHMQMRFDLSSAKKLLPCCSIPDEMIFIYECFTDQFYRGHGIFPYALQHFCHWASSKFKKAYLRIDPQNISSINSVKKAGFKFSGIVYHLWIFGFPVKPFGKSQEDYSAKT